MAAGLLILLAATTNYGGAPSSGLILSPTTGGVLGLAAKLNHGVYDDHVDVVILDAAGTDQEYNDTPTISNDVCNQASDADCVKRTWRALHHFFEKAFQLYGRTVRLHPYYCNDVATGNACPKGQALANYIQDTFDPFAVISLSCLASGCSGLPVPAAGDLAFPYFANDGIEYFSYRNFGLSTHYHDGFLDDAHPNGASPYFWSVVPSIEDIYKFGQSWLTYEVTRDVTSPTARDGAQLLQGKQRRIALVYEAPSGQQIDQSALQDIVTKFKDDYSIGAPLDGPYQIGDPASDPANISKMQGRDTSVVCLLCAPVGLDDFATVEAKANYYPEFMFISGELADPYQARYNNQAAFQNAFGISEYWQLPTYTSTYWFRAYQQADPWSTVSQQSGMAAYQLLMQLYGALQLAGQHPDFNSVATGLYQWQRKFSSADSNGVLPGGAPAAGYGAPGTGFDTGHSFLRGMELMRWDSGGTPPGGPYLRAQGFRNTGCYRIVDSQERFSAGTDVSHNLTSWQHQPFNEMQGLSPGSGGLPPCTGDSSGDVSP